MAPESSNNTYRGWLRDGRVLIQNNPATHTSRVFPGQTIEIVEKRIKKQGPLHIVYEDPHLVVIDKPSGLLSVSSRFEMQKTAHAHIKDRYPKKIYVVHRLDQDTSGLMIFALSEMAYHFLKSQLADHKIDRIYYAVVEGAMAKGGTWDCYLHEDSTYHVHVVKNKDLGERAITHYSCLLQTAQYSLARFCLETGKKNQIRVQAAHAGHPIAGDFKYGAKDTKANRLMLHAQTLSFIHPVTKKKMTFSSALPAPFQQFFPSSLFDAVKSPSKTKKS